MNVNEGWGIQECWYLLHKKKSPTSILILYLTHPD